MARRTNTASERNRRRLDGTPRTMDRLEPPEPDRGSIDMFLGPN